MEGLKNIWNELASRYTDDAERVNHLWAELEKGYGDKKRYYHNLSHLAYMVGKAFTYKDHLTDFDAVLFSIFYHDLVYDPKRHDNEEKSSVLAQERLGVLGVPEGRIALCQQLILATKNHADLSVGDARFMIDMDLGILGESPEAYREYAKNIRKEYAMYPGFLYRKGRKKVLQHFLGMDTLFKTEAFRALYEHQAKANIQSELDQL